MVEKLIIYAGRKPQVHGYRVGSPTGRSITHSQYQDMKKTMDIEIRPTEEYERWKDKESAKEMSKIQVERGEAPEKSSSMTWEDYFKTHGDKLTPEQIKNLSPFIKKQYEPQIQEALEKQAEARPTTKEEFQRELERKQRIVATLEKQKEKETPTKRTEYIKSLLTRQGYDVTETPRGLISATKEGRKTVIDPQRYDKEIRADIPPSAVYQRGFEKKLGTGRMITPAEKRAVSLGYAKINWEESPFLKGQMEEAKRGALYSLKLGKWAFGEAPSSFVGYVAKPFGAKLEKVSLKAREYSARTLERVEKQKWAKPLYAVKEHIIEPSLRLSKKATGVLAGVGEEFKLHPKRTYYYVMGGVAISEVLGAVGVSKFATTGAGKKLIQPTLKWGGRALMGAYGIQTGLEAMTKKPGLEREKFIGRRIQPISLLYAGGYISHRGKLYQKTWEDIAKKTKYTGLEKGEAKLYKMSTEGKALITGQGLKYDIMGREAYIHKAIRKGADVKPFLSRGEELWKYLKLTEFKTPGLKGVVKRTKIDPGALERFKPLKPTAPLVTSQFLQQYPSVILGGSLVPYSVFKSEFEGMKLAPHDIDLYLKKTKIKEAGKYLGKELAELEKPLEEKKLKLAIKEKAFKIHVRTEKKWEKLVEAHGVREMLHPNIMAVSPIYKTPSAYILTAKGGVKVLSPSIQERRALVGAFGDDRLKDIPKFIAQQRGKIRIAKEKGIDVKKQEKILKELEVGRMSQLAIAEEGLKKLAGQKVKVMIGGTGMIMKLPKPGELPKYERMYGKRAIGELLKRKEYKKIGKEKIVEEVLRTKPTKRKYPEYYRPPYYAPSFPYKAPYKEYPKTKPYPKYPKYPEAKYPETKYPEYPGYPKYPTGYPKYVEYPRGYKGTPAYDPYAPYTPRTYRPYTPYDPYEEIPEPKTPKALWLPFGRKNPLTKAYDVLTKISGRWVTIDKDLPRGRAIKKGEEFTRRTLRASFKLMPSGQTTMKDIREYAPDPRYFRGFKIQHGKRVALKDEWIEFAHKRLDVGSEVMEIHRERRKEKKSRGRF